MKIDYYISLNSPWTYLCSARFLDLVAKHGVTTKYQAGAVRRCLRTDWRPAAA